MIVLDSQAALAGTADILGLHSIPSPVSKNLQDLLPGDQKIEVPTVVPEAVPEAIAA